MSTVPAYRCPDCLGPLREHCQGKPPPGTGPVGCDCWICDQCRVFGVLDDQGTWRWAALRTQGAGT